MQQREETPHQFWQGLNGLAAVCDFGCITTTIVLEMFNLHMNNEKMQKNICTGSKEPEQALEIATAIEEG